MVHIVTLTGPSQLAASSLTSGNQVVTLTAQQQVCMTVDMKGEAIPIQAWTGPEGSRRLRLPEFLDSQQMRIASGNKMPTRCNR